VRARQNGNQAKQARFSKLSSYLDHHRVRQRLRIDGNSEVETASHPFAKTVHFRNVDTPQIRSRLRACLAVDYQFELVSVSSADVESPTFDRQEFSD